MKNRKIIITVVCFIIVVAIVCLLLLKNPPESKPAVDPVTATTESQGVSSTAATTIADSEPTAVTTVMTAENESEEEFYNSLLPEERVVYDKVREDEDFGYKKWQSYDKNVPKNKKINFGRKEIAADYCFTFTRENQFNHNPDNVPESEPFHMYIDENKNRYFFDSSGEFREYEKYYKVGAGYGEEKNVSEKEALQEIYSVTNKVIPSLKELEITYSSASESGHLFMLTKRLSALACETVTVETFPNGEIKYIKSGVYADAKPINAETEKKLMERLDEFIKQTYGDKVKRYDIGKTSIYARLQGVEVIVFYVTFTENVPDQPELNPQYIENVVIRID